jgi:hypothetical protein
LQASCGGALQIFPEAMTDNILVIEARAALRRIDSPRRRRGGKSSPDKSSRKKSSRKKCGAAHVMRTTPRRRQ